MAAWHYLLEVGSVSKWHLRSIMDNSPVTSTGSPSESAPRAMRLAPSITVDMPCMFSRKRSCEYESLFSVRKARCSVTMVNAQAWRGAPARRK